VTGDTPGRQLGPVSGALPEPFVVPNETPADRRPVTLEALPEHFRKLITVDGSGCWIWMMRSRGLTYTPTSPGQFTFPDGRTVLAYRAIWTETVGPIPDGAVIDHLCERPRCVNPAHLELVTSGMNTRRHRVRRDAENAFSGRGGPFYEADEMQKAYRRGICAFCGSRFTKRREWQTYCSRDCRKGGWEQKQLAFPGESRVERRFREWISTASGRYVEAEVVRRARQLRSWGRRRYGIAALIEVIRFHAPVPQDDRDPYKVNNSHRSLLARKVMAENADLDGFFEVRDLRGRT
jgi:hypothetical protein